MSKLDWYAKFVAYHPFVVVCVTSLISCLCMTVAYFWEPLPSFADPQLGFETKGTVLSGRKFAWELLREASRTGGPLVSNPNEAYLAWLDERDRNSKKPRKRKKDDEENVEVTSEESDLSSIRSLMDEGTMNDGPAHATVIKLDSGEEFDVYGNITIHPGNKRKSNLYKDRDKWMTLKKVAEGTERVQTVDQATISYSPRTSLPCGPPSSSYSHIIFTSPDPNVSLWSRKAMISICLLDILIMRTKRFYSLCQTYQSDTQCCPSWSVGSYVALLRDKKSCLGLSDADVDAVLDLLQLCAPYYRSGFLQADCEERGICQEVPKACIKGDAVFHILHYMTDFQFFANQSETATSEEKPEESAADVNRFLRYSVLYLPVARSSAMMEYYLEVEGILLQNDKDAAIKVVAVEFGVKESVFDFYLLRDTALVGISALSVVIISWIYTGSFLVTASMFLALGFSLGYAFFLYRVVFGISFFPFVNVLVTVVAVGIGADDVFILVKTWRTTKLNTSKNKCDSKSTELISRVRDTLDRAFVSMFVTSMTTVTAFLSSYVTHVTAVKCFSVFAGLTVASNFLLMMTLLPGSLVISYHYCCSPSSYLTLVSSESGPTTSQLASNPFPPIADTSTEAVVDPPSSSGSPFFLSAFSHGLSSCVGVLVVFLRWLWLFALSSVGASAIVIVLYEPGLRLPSTPTFRLFPLSSLMEQYDRTKSSLTFFVRETEGDYAWKLPLRFVWGVIPDDNSNPLDPTSKGTLQLDPSFNMSAPESQEWLMTFCHRIRNQSFYQPTLGPLLPNCFIETFERYMANKPCSTASTSSEECCVGDNETFPYSPPLFNKCLVDGIGSLYRTPSKFFVAGDLGPRFGRGTTEEEWKSPQVKAVVVEYDSSVSYSLSYLKMSSFFEEVEAWTRKELESAPPGMRNGWFFSDFDFYDLQQELVHGSLMSVAIASALSFAVLLGITLSPLLSLLAVISVVQIIFITLAILVVLGWELGVLESVSVALIIGLGVDFTLHYAVAFKASTGNRKKKVSKGIAKALAPVSMAALTTFLAGAIMIRAHVLPYIQIGTLLMSLSFISWFYSTVYFNALLAVWGPENTVLGFRWSCCVRKKGSSSQKSCVQRQEDTSEESMDKTFVTPSTGGADSNSHAGTAQEPDSLNGTRRRSALEIETVSSGTQPSRRVVTAETYDVEVLTPLPSSRPVHLPPRPRTRIVVRRGNHVQSGNAEVDEQLEQLRINFRDLGSRHLLRTQGDEAVHSSFV